MYVEKYDCYLKSALVDLCGFSDTHAEQLIDKDKVTAIYLISIISDIADLINRIKKDFRTIK